MATHLVCALQLSHCKSSKEDFVTPLTLKRMWIIGGALCLSATFSAVHAQSQFGSHPGYISDVDREMYTIDTEVVLIDRPAPLESKSTEIINDRLTKEFKEQFKYRFGVTEMEQTLNSPGRSDEYSYYTGRTVSLKEYQQEQRAFGEYMARRLMEYHIDNWAKTNPAVRPVYELKDKVTNLDMEVKKGYKVKVRYSLSGGHLDFDLDNPIDMEAKLRLEMGGGFLASRTEETVISLGANVTSLWRVSTLVRFYDGIYQVVGTRRITPALSGTITGSTDTKDSGYTEKQDIILVGFTYSN